VTITEVPVDAIPRVGEGVESPPPRVEDPPRKSVPAGGELGVNKILLNTLSRSSAEGPTCDIAGEWTYEVEAFNNGVGPIVNGWVQVVMVWSGASVCNPDVLNEPEMPAGFGPSQGGWSYSDITNDGHSQSRVWGIDPPAGGGPFKLWAIFSVNE